MRFRLLLISAVTIFVTAFVSGGNNSTSIDNVTITETEVISESADMGNHEISAPDKTLQPPRQSNFASVPTCRSVSKRNSNQSTLRHNLYISGKPVVHTFVKMYQQTLSLFASGLNIPSIYLISLGRLII